MLAHSCVKPLCTSHDKQPAELTDADAMYVCLLLYLLGQKASVEPVRDGIRQLCTRKLLHAACIQDQHEALASAGHDQ